jgi:hypothetical protein
MVGGAELPIAELSAAMGCESPHPPSSGAHPATTAKAGTSIILSMSNSLLLPPTATGNPVYSHQGCLRQVAIADDCAMRSHLQTSVEPAESLAPADG